MWYNPMWIISISLLFLSAPQVFLKFILILILSKLEHPVLQTGLSGFVNRICPTSTPDSSKSFWICPIIYSDMSGHSAKNLKLDQNLSFWFISSTHLDLCDHVKFLWCLKGEGGWIGWVGEVQTIKNQSHHQKLLSGQTYPASLADSRDSGRTCPSPTSDMSSLSALSGSVAGLQWLWPDMSGPQPEHVRSNQILQWLSLESDISGPQTGF
jgi:hypothetical protein